MDYLKNYWWVIITVPLLAIFLYFITKRISPADKLKQMKGISIIAILFGIFLLTFTILNEARMNKIYILFGICWILLGVGRLVYDYKKKKSQGHNA